MKAVIAHRDGSPHVVQLPEPPLGARTVQIRVSHSAVWLPDELALISVAAKRLKKGQDGLPLGRMCSGILDAIGQRATGLKEGLRVAAFGEPYVYHAGNLSVPATLVVELPKKVNHEEGAFAGQGAVAMNLFRATGSGLGETVLVFGAGMTGILAAQIARAAGTVPVLVDESDHRLSKARNVGITHASLPERDEFVREIDKLTGGQGADAAIVTSDSFATASEWAAMALRVGGTLVLGEGSPGTPPVEEIEAKELTVRAVRGGGAGHGDPHFEQQGVVPPRQLVRWTVRDNMVVFLNLLADRKVQIAPLISERIPLERAPHLYDKIARSPQTAIGAVLTL